MQDIRITNIDSYMALVPQKLRPLLEKMRKTIRRAAPQAEEMISYGMPAFRYHGMLVYFAAFKNHASFFPGSSSLIRSLKDELKGYKTSTGTIQFTVENPLPASLITRIVKARVKENLEKEKMKKAKAKPGKK